MKKRETFSTELPKGGIVLGEKLERNEWSSIWTSESSDKETSNTKMTGHIDMRIKAFDIQLDLSTGILHVSALGHHSVTVYNSSGYLMNHYIFTNKMEINTSEYPRGIYAVQVDRTMQKLILD